MEMNQQIMFIPTNLRLEKVRMATNRCKICIHTAIEIFIGKVMVAMQVLRLRFGWAMTLVIRPITKVKRSGMWIGLVVVVLW